MAEERNTQRGDVKGHENLKKEGSRAKKKRDKRSKFKKQLFGGFGSYRRALRKCRRKVRLKTSDN